MRGERGWRRKWERNQVRAKGRGTRRARERETERQRRRKVERDKDSARNFFLFTACPSWYFSGLVAARIYLNIWNSERAPTPPREDARRRHIPFPPPSLSFHLSLTNDNTPRMHACVHASIRTSSAPDNLGAASSADVSSYSVLKAMTLSPIRAIIHLSRLFSLLKLSSSPLPPSPRILAVQFYPCCFHGKRERSVDGIVQ